MEVVSTRIPFLSTSGVVEHGRGCPGLAFSILGPAGAGPTCGATASPVEGAEALPATDVLATLRASSPMLKPMPCCVSFQLSGLGTEVLGLFVGVGSLRGVMESSGRVESGGGGGVEIWVKADSALPRNIFVKVDTTLMGRVEIDEGLTRSSGVEI